MKNNKPYSFKRNKLSYFWIVFFVCWIIISFTLIFVYPNIRNTIATILIVSIGGLTLPTIQVFKSEKQILLAEEQLTKANVQIKLAQQQLEQQHQINLSLDITFVNISDEIERIIESYKMISEYRKFDKFLFERFLTFINHYLHLLKKKLSAIEKRYGYKFEDTTKLLLNAIKISEPYININYVSVEHVENYDYDALESPQTSNIHSEGATIYSTDYTGLFNAVQMLLQNHFGLEFSLGSEHRKIGILHKIVSSFTGELKLQCKNNEIKNLIFPESKLNEFYKVEQEHAFYWNLKSVLDHNMLFLSFNDNSVKSVKLTERIFCIVENKDKKYKLYFKDAITDKNEINSNDEFFEYKNIKDVKLSIYSKILEEDYIFNKKDIEEEINLIKFSKLSFISLNQSFDSSWSSSSDAKYNKDANYENVLIVEPLMNGNKNIYKSIQDYFDGKHLISNTKGYYFVPYRTLVFEKNDKNTFMNIDDYSIYPEDVIDIRKGYYIKRTDKNNYPNIYKIQNDQLIEKNISNFIVNDNLLLIKKNNEYILYENDKLIGNINSDIQINYIYKNRNFYQALVIKDDKQMNNVYNEKFELLFEDIDYIEFTKKWIYVKYENQKTSQDFLTYYNTAPYKEFNFDYSNVRKIYTKEDENSLLSLINYSLSNYFEIEIVVSKRTNSSTPFLSIGKNINADIEKALLKSVLSKVKFEVEEFKTMTIYKFKNDR